MSSRTRAVAVLIALTAILSGCDYFKPVTPENAKGVIHVYSAPHCAACKAAKPVVKKLQEAGFPIREINVNRQPTKAGKAGVHMIPTFIHYYNGEETDRIVGTASERELKRMFR